MNELKIAAAKRLNKLLRFVQYWSIQEKPSSVHPTALIEARTKLYRQVSVGRYSYIGHDCFIGSGTIGAFCSIAWNVTIGADEHPLGRVSKHPFWYSTGHPNIRSDVDRWQQEKAPPVIGNDVWIGTGATILRGAVIEDGAVVGAGTVVGGHVPAYGIVGGIPARLIKLQFEEEVCRALRATEWWAWDERKLAENAALFGDVNAFLAVHGDRNHHQPASAPA